ncbi:hypothetical protein Pla110_27300 [Polystyrenella longa]|uniref:DUF1552 domain-containing protein n=1 Tax=Polystyrenella longa TaxID=2528007 RepID=A0A518CP53_9PLAN|nr:DUF1552 domain-containing protein [Polystyrenella longa]QDU80993.1 hypothetical protein Pla110_27300 [Polystyrenella longa]
MPDSLKLNRRAVLKGIAGATLALPILEAMGSEVSQKNPRRFCAIYTANGMALPKEEHEIDEWHWFPQEVGQEFKFNKSTEPLSPFRNQLSFLGGMHHPNGTKADPHTCSDMWLTGAPLHNPKPGTYNSVALDQLIALHTKQHCRQPSLVLSIDAGTGFLSRTGTISYSVDGKPVPAENSPRRIFDRLFRGDTSSLEHEREKLNKRIKLVDAVLDTARSLNKQLGQSDREKMDQYLTSLNEVESRLIASEKWIDIPLKNQDYSHLNLDASPEGEPADYYQTMFDLIALAFDADITRSVTFMLNREDGMGISDTFPIKLGLASTHHQLSHAADKEGQLNFAKYDLFLSEQISHFLSQLQEYKDADGTVLDNSLVLFGSGASTTHNPRNLPTLLAGGANMGVKHGSHWRKEDTRLSNLYLSILHSMGIEKDSFGDSTGTFDQSVFTGV